MEVEETLQEVTRSAKRFKRLLTVVMSYDDLLADVSKSFILDGCAIPLSIGRTTVGESRFEDDSFLLADRWASSSHAVLDRRSGADVIRDNGSRNGVFVNGDRVEEHRLADGDVIEIGHTLMCYRRVDEQLAGLLTGEADAPAIGPTRTFNPAMTVLARDLARIALSSEPVLVLGETGTGKEVVAAHVHALSERHGRFRAVDCGAIPENLFESTLFGHTKGSFTGAGEAREGEISLADGGSLFLDEVGNTNPACQAKLLRVIETGEVTAVGASGPQKVEVRWVAATNANLMSADGSFREDLLRRLAGYTAHLPPLRERREDLGVLTAHLLRDAGRESAAITVPAARALFLGPLPGNVRQLRAALRSAALLAGNETIDEAHLPKLDDAAAPEPVPAAPASSGRATPDSEQLARALADSGGNVAQAARALGTHAKQVYRWIERHGLTLDDYRRD